MEDLIIIEYLKSKGMINEHEYTELLNKASIKSHPTQSSNPQIHVDKSDKYSHFFDSFKEVTKDMSESEKHKFVDTLKDYGMKSTEHFNESYAKYVVSTMWHTESGHKHIGERFSMYKAIEICDRYKGIIDSNITHADVYVAINAHYHDYHCLYKSWFGEDVEHQLIESAVVFWFKDEDYDEGVKLWNFFRED